MKNVTVHEAREKQTDGYTYVDVRSVQEFEVGHPDGAVNVPLLDRDRFTGQMTPNREFVAVMRANFPVGAKLLIGCHVGGRSAQATQILAASGYEDVSNVLGGFGGARDPVTGTQRAEGWAPAGLPVEAGTAAGRSYAELHARARKESR